MNIHELFCERMTLNTVFQWFFFLCLSICLNSLGEELTRWVRLMMNFALIKNLFYHWD